MPSLSSAEQGERWAKIVRTIARTCFGFGLGLGIGFGFGLGFGFGFGFGLGLGLAQLGPSAGAWPGWTPIGLEGEATIGWRPGAEGWRLGPGG